MNIFCDFRRKIVRFSFILLIFSTVFSGNIYAQVLIIGFGDSITAGVPFIDGKNGNGLRVGGYEPTLENLMNNAGRAAFVYNHGVGGETTPDGVNRLDSVLSSQPSNTVLIMEGTNDHWFGISAQTVAFNIGVMIDKCRAKHTTPIVGNLTPARRDIHDDIPRIYNPAIVNIVNAKQAYFVDHYALVVGNWENLEQDSVHPNEAGYEALAKNWFDKIIENSNSSDSSSSGCFISTSKLSVNN
jgi:lysophospholipase L1-like esterase